MASASPPLSAGRPSLEGLGQQLRDMFQAMVAGPMPEHLVDIIDQLEAQAMAAGRPADAGAATPRS